MAFMLPIYLASVYHPLYLTIVTLAICISALIYCINFRSLSYIYFHLTYFNS